MAANDCIVTDHSAAAIKPDRYELTRKLRQMHAATIAISGGGFESFSEMNDELRDHYLCMLSDLASEAVQIDRKHNGAEASHG